MNFRYLISIVAILSIFTLVMFGSFIVNAQSPVITTEMEGDGGDIFGGGDSCDGCTIRSTGEGRCVPCEHSGMRCSSDSQSTTARKCVL